MLSYLIENNFLLPLDLYFAKRLLKDQVDEDLVIFFSLIMGSYRKGDVCLQIDNDLKSSLFLGMENEKKSLLNALLLRTVEKLPIDLVEDNPDEKKYIQKPICQYGNNFYLQKNWTFENRVLKEIELFLTGKPKDLFSEQKFIHVLQERAGLEEAQKKAIKTAFYQRLTFISGGPGTGKTYTASQMIEVFSLCFKEDRKFRVLLCAPTGKASFHLKSKMNKNFLDEVELEAMTLHALLKLFPDRLKEFKKDIYAYDLLIVDEASMIDLRIMAFLLSSISENTRLILIGDKDQLAPIETGQVFAELCEMKQTVFLDKTHRFSNPMMIQFIKGVCEGLKEKAFSAFDKNDPSISLFPLTDNCTQLEPYLNHFPTPQKTMFEPEALLSSLEDFQILSSLKHGKLGVNKINDWIVSQLIRNTDAKSLYSCFFAYPIIITSNDYGKNLFNGMMGFVIAKMEKFSIPYGKNVKAYFRDTSGAVLEFSLHDLPKWDLAYAISVHKSQGSEFNEVVVVIPDGSESFGKELLYTAATRAKNKLTLLAKRPTLSNMIDKSGQKISMLKKRLG